VPTNDQLVFSPWRAKSGCRYEAWMYTKTTLKWQDWVRLAPCQKKLDGHATCRMCPGEDGS